jgi:hypothetical protein
MTPNEVGGLQALAMANGGSLTINPETGLPEAGFLSKILPMVAGALLAPMTAGTSLAFLASSPMTTALTVGGLTGLATGSLNKGLMAGLGAFGGAGIGQGLAATGAAAAKAAVPAITAPTAATTSPLFSSGAGFSGVGNLNAAIPNIAANPFTAANASLASTPGAGFAGVGNLNAALPNVAAPIMPAGTATIQPIAAAAPVQSVVRLSDAARAMTPMEQLTGGLKAVAANPMEGLKSVWANMPSGSGISSAASLADAMRSDYKPPKQSKSFIRPYRLERNYEQSGHGDTGYGTSERRYFDDQFTALDPYEAPGPEYAASGGLMGLASFADGGYTRYTGDDFYGEYDPKKDDYYYVPGSSGGQGYFMVRDDARGSAGSTGGKGGSTGPYGYDYDRASGTFTQKSGPGTGTPKLSTDPRAYNAESLAPLYQQYFGRDVDPEGLAAYTGRNFSPAQLDEIFKASPEYAARQQQLAAQKKEASYATATQAANMYQDILGRPIDRAALDFYTQEQRLTPADLKKTLMSSEEYLTNLTKPFVPPPQVNPQTGQVSIAGAMRTPQQEAARPRDMSDFYAMMNNQLAQQSQNQTYAVGGPVEQMSAMNAIGGNEMYPQSQFQTPAYSNPMVQRPMPTNVIPQGLDALVDRYSGEQRMAGGGLSSLGGYSDGGRLLKGPGDGVSDSIPAVIGDRQPARLADGEFVVPARIVSELGNGSTEAGARKLYAMMDRVQKARGKTTGKGKVAKNTKADKFLPA